MLIIDGQQVNLKDLEVLSDKGSECVVYKYKNSVIKIFKKDYEFSNFTLEDINYVHNIKTRRILFPTSAILDKDGKMVGYQMPLIKGTKDIQKEPMHKILKELLILQFDMMLLERLNIGLMDVNPSNSIYNGKLYLIDPGNYLINDMSTIKRQLDPLNTCNNNQKLLTTWNENKINQLFDMLLFSHNPRIDPYQFRLIAQFFIKEKEKKRINYNYEIFKKYFDPNLSVEDSIKKFMKEHIKENKKEREWYLSGYKNK